MKSNEKSRFKYSTPLLVVSFVNSLLGTADRSVISVHTEPTSPDMFCGATSDWHIISSSSTMSVCPGRKLRV